MRGRRVPAPVRAVPSAMALAAVLLLATAPAAAARVAVVDDTLHAPSLGALKRLKVLLPPSYPVHPRRRYPVLYYLHGLWGTEADWIENGGLAAAAESAFARSGQEAILVVPDGDDGFYRTWSRQVPLDSCNAIQVRPVILLEGLSTYCVAHQRYDAYVVRDLVAHVDARYRTRPGSAHRGIAGVSMGGYGAVTLALRFPEVFGAAASHSGIVSLLLREPMPPGGHPSYATDIAGVRTGTGVLWPQLARIFGDSLPTWQAGDPARLAAAARRAGTKLPALSLDVGHDDPFRDQTRALHAELDALGIPHEFAVRAGAHGWEYWRAHAAEGLRWLLARVR